MPSRSSISQAVTSCDVPAFPFSYASNGRGRTIRFSFPDSWEDFSPTVKEDFKDLGSVRRFLRNNGFTLRRNVNGSSFKMEHKKIGIRFTGFTFDEVLDYAVNHCYPGYQVKTHREVLVPSPTRLPDHLIQSEDNIQVRIANQDYRDVVYPENSLTVTDPPYGVGYRYDVHNDQMSDEDWLLLLQNIQKPCVLILPWDKAYVLSQKWGLPDDEMIWTYNGGYRPHQYRKILWYGCRPDVTRPEVGQEYKNPKDPSSARGIAQGRKARLYYWWQIEQVMNFHPEKTSHPCQIPEEVIRRIVQSTALPGQTIFDPFLGSGTTGVVARRYGHPFIGCDLSPDYCKIAIDRIAKSTYQFGKRVDSIA